MKQSERNKTGGKGRAGGRSIVNPDALAGLKKRAEDLGLIVHARGPASSGRTPSRKKDNKK
jgi:hypothetical protein